jgi:hypothetical protein
MLTESDQKIAEELRARLLAPVLNPANEPPGLVRDQTDKSDGASGARFPSTRLAVHMSASSGCWGPAKPSIYVPCFVTSTK